MLVIELTPSNHLAIKCQYSYSYIDRLHELDSASFDRESKKWIISYADFPKFETLFKGEIVYKTPRWVIRHEPMPDMSQMYQLKQRYPVPASKLKPYDYQNYGIQFMINKLYETGFVINADSVGLGN